MTSPSLLSRESTTLSPRWAQNGHFICLRPLLLASRAGEVFQTPDAQIVLGHEHEAEQHHRDERDRMRDDRTGDRLIVLCPEKGGDPPTIRGVIAADTARCRYG